MITVNFLKVATTINTYSKFLLTIQDYLIKWVDAIPMPDQTVTKIVAELTQIFTVMGCHKFHIPIEGPILRVYNIKANPPNLWHHKPLHIIPKVTAWLEG